MSSIIFIPRYLTLEKFTVNSISGITNLVGNSPFLLIFLWFLWVVLRTESLASQAIVSQIVLHELKNPSSLFKLIHFILQTGQLPSYIEQGLLTLIGGQRPTTFSLQFRFLEWCWFCLSEHRRIQIFPVSKGLRGFLLFYCLLVWNVGVGRPPWVGSFPPQPGILQDGQIHVFPSWGQM